MEVRRSAVCVLVVLCTSRSVFAVLEEGYVVQATVVGCVRAFVSCESRLFLAFRIF